MRAAFASFASGTAPAYESPHYRVTRMQPYFNPGPDAATQAPPIYLGGVQRKACALAGAVADGFVSHPTNSNPRYLRETCLPALADGCPARGAGPGRDRVRDRHRHVGHHRGHAEGDVLVERERQRRLLAFLYSTPAYAPTLELYGWTEVGPRLRDLIRHDRWDDLAAVLSDEVLDTLVPCGTFDELPGLLRDRFIGLGPGHRGVAAARRRRRRRLPVGRGRAASGLRRFRLSGASGR